MNQIILRQATNDFNALITAQAMENANANVFSIITQPQGNFLVFAKYQPPNTPKKIDHEITKCMKEYY